MCLYHSQPHYPALELSFSEQLNTLSIKNPQTIRLRYTLKLPDQSRYLCLDPKHIHSELSKVFEKRYPLGFEIINLSPSSNDDHFINVILQIRTQ